MLKTGENQKKLAPKTQEARERVLHSVTQQVKAKLEEVATHDQ